MQFGERLKKARQDKILTQETVAKYMIVSRQTISSWENEKTYPDITSLIKLSEYYDISLNLLLKEDNGMKEYLKKKDVISGMKPISQLLVTTNILFLVILIIDALNIVKLNDTAEMFIMVICIINFVAVMKIDKLMKKFGIKIKNKWINILMIVLFVAFCLSILPTIISGFNAGNHPHFR
ncbi:helix-turn-helix domain-containing protein [Apilactobacillus apisilvae]|uniref:Helix-turn-helix domain-containing protein n=1 Tax=Apilactobacillus apisilvae TaxID=2923364 RepID=A0ABY4PH04_9LACO|nr:helix-turn-helix transcriptional regulator [Apilactobacillus apisilvae]UQS84657.1 helix-turn-helix domain-containing protein [Apilactobacillus apisilvae]